MRSPLSSFFSAFSGKLGPNVSGTSVRTQTLPGFFSRHVLQPLKVVPSGSKFQLPLCLECRPQRVRGAFCPPIRLMALSLPYALQDSVSLNPHAAQLTACTQLPSISRYLTPSLHPL